MQHKKIATKVFKSIAEFYSKSEIAFERVPFAGTWFVWTREFAILSN